MVLELKEAIIRIKEHKDIHFKEEFPRAIKITESLEMAIEILEKQIPKDVINKQTNYIKYCPVCESALLRESDKYCSDCGQKLNWN